MTQATTTHPLKRLRLNHEPPYDTVTSLARATGLNPGTISRFERGGAIGVGSAYLLSRALGLTVDEFAAVVGDQVRTTNRGAA